MTKSHIRKSQEYRRCASCGWPWSAGHECKTPPEKLLEQTQALRAICEKVLQDLEWRGRQPADSDYGLDSEQDKQLTELRATLGKEKDVKP